MKRIFAGMAAALLAAVLVFPFEADAVSAEKAIVLDSQTGRVLYEKRSEERALIASTTKIMTALIICEQCNVLDRVRIPEEAVGVEGSSMYLQKGEILTVQELLYGLMLHSGNDAAVALAIYCAGTVEGFAQLMNDKAHRLGLKGTHFENPNGLDSPNHYSNAADMARLASYAMENPIFSRIVSTKSIKIGDRYLTNHNKLLWRIEGADGVKTGFTKAAGRILVSSAMRSGRRLVAVTMNAPDDWNDHAVLLENGFSKYQLRHIVAQGDVLGTVEVAGGDAGFVELIASEAFSYPLALEEDINIVIPLPGFVYAPVVNGQEAGFAYICIGSNVIGKVSVKYGNTVEQIREEEKSFWQKLFGD